MTYTPTLRPSAVKAKVDISYYQEALECSLCEFPLTCDKKFDFWL